MLQPLRSALVLLFVAGILTLAPQAHAEGYRQVTGYLEYGDGAALDFKPIRYVQVVVRTAVLPFGYTTVSGWDGTYSVVLPDSLLPAGSNVSISFMARNFAADVYLDLDGWSNEWLTWSAQTTVPAGTDPVNLSAAVYSSSMSAHFNIAEGMAAGRSYAQWYRSDNDDITKAMVQYPDLDWSNFSSWYREITLSGPEYKGIDGTYGGNASDHGFDDETILHEYAHHLTYDISKHDSPGGSHFLWTDNGFDFAWSEGFATYFAHAVSDTFWFHKLSLPGSLEPIPVLTIADVMDGAPGFATMKYPAGSEGMTQASLWDLHDPENEPHDSIGGMRGTIFSIFDTNIDRGENVDGSTIQRNILGFHQVLWQRGGEAQHMAFDQILHAHGILPHLHGQQDYAVQSVEILRSSSDSFFRNDEWISVLVTLSRANDLYGATPIPVDIELVSVDGSLPYRLATALCYPHVGSAVLVPVQLPWRDGYAVIRVTIDPKDRCAESIEINNQMSSYIFKFETANFISSEDSPDTGPVPNPN